MKSIHLIMVSRTNQTRVSGDGCVVVLSDPPEAGFYKGKKRSDTSWVVTPAESCCKIIPNIDKYQGFYLTLYLVCSSIDDEIPGLATN